MVVPTTCQHSAAVARRTRVNDKLLGGQHGRSRNDERPGDLPEPLLRHGSPRRRCRGSSTEDELGSRRPQQEGEFVDLHLPLREQRLEERRLANLGNGLVRQSHESVVRRARGAGGDDDGREGLGRRRQASDEEGLLVHGTRDCRLVCTRSAVLDVAGLASVSQCETSPARIDDLPRAARVRTIPIRPPLQTRCAIHPSVTRPCVKVAEKGLRRGADSDRPSPKQLGILVFELFDLSLRVLYGVDRVWRAGVTLEGRERATIFPAGLSRRLRGWRERTHLHAQWCASTTSSRPLHRS